MPAWDVRRVLTPRPHENLADSPEEPVGGVLGQHCCLDHVNAAAIEDENVAVTMDIENSVGLVFRQQLVKFLNKKFEGLGVRVRVGVGVGVWWFLTSLSILLPVMSPSGGRAVPITATQRPRPS